MAKLDILMTVWNCEPYIADTLASIQRQTLSDFRLIVIDDGSTDQTGTIIRAAAADDPRIEYHHQPNAGIVTALNNGLRFCTAPYIGRHDGDDISYPDRFEKEVAYLEQNPDCAAVSALARHIDEQSRPTGVRASVEDLTTGNFYAIPASEPYLIQPLLTLRHSALTSAGGYRLLTVAEDTDLYWRLSETGKLHILPEILGDYRIHGDSISSRTVLSGRRIAVWSQLSALSARRRRTGQPDISFTPELKQKLDAARTLRDMFAVVAPLLQPAEKPWFHSAIAAKLVAMCYSRPYEPDAADITFIRAVPRADPGIASRPGYQAWRESLMAAAIRLFLTGHVAEALRIIPWQAWPVLAARVLFRVAFPPALKTRIKTLFGKN